MRTERADTQKISTESEMDVVCSARETGPVRNFV